MKSSPTYMKVYNALLLAIKLVAALVPSTAAKNLELLITQFQPNTNKK